MNLLTLENQINIKTVFFANKYLKNRINKIKQGNTAKKYEAFPLFFTPFATVKYTINHEIERQIVKDTIGVPETDIRLFRDSLILTQIYI